MAYKDIYYVATAPGTLLVRQTAVALIKAATDVTLEDAGTQNHVKRLAWANDVLETRNAITQRASDALWKILENPTIAATMDNCSDSDVQFVVNSLVDTFAATY